MSDIADILSLELPFAEGFAVSWMGPHPLQRGYCAGSEDGQLQFFDADFKLIGGIDNTGSGEAINSVVGYGEWIAASTRQQVSFFPEEAIGRKRPIKKAAIGAHSLAVLSNGYFVAALGPKGLMFARPGAKPEDSFIVDGADPGIPMNVYQVAALPGLGLACAVRSGGILFGRWQQAGPSLQVLTFPGFDAVDVCSIATNKHPHAIAAVSKDGKLVMTRDIFHDPSPRTMQFGSVKGVVYRMVTCQGHLFILTNSALYGLCDVAGQFLDGTLDANDASPLLVLPMKAIDLNVVENRLVIVELDQVRLVDVAEITKNMPKDQGEKPQAYSPTWRSEAVSRLTREFAVA